MELYYNTGFEKLQYNGNITGVKWKSAWDDNRKAYGYTYDKMNRIKGAYFVAGANQVWQDEGLYAMQVLGDKISANEYKPGYDKNGNILSLKRYGLTDNSPSVVDAMQYDYGSGLDAGNQLKSVTDSGNEEGFKDGTNAGDDYEYDANGNMTSDKNKGIDSIQYNLLNLPEEITLTSGDMMRYVYDAAGAKVAREIYKDGQLSKRTDYIGEGVAENDTLRFFLTDEGRAEAKYDQYGSLEGFKYQYFIKDHLGNTRLTIGEPDTHTYVATMEDTLPSTRMKEYEEFANIFETEDNTVPEFNHTAATTETPAPEYYSKLDGTNNIIGPAKSLQVFPGDKINAWVFAKYLDASSYNDQLLGGAVLASFGTAMLTHNPAMGLAGAGENVQVTDILEGSILDGLNVLNTEDPNVPRAYLNVIVFDKDFNYIDEQSGKVAITDVGKYVPGSSDYGVHEQVNLPQEITIQQAGYVLIYLSNETPGSEVYFDDLTIQHVTTPIIQKDDYYPFGLSIAGLSSRRDRASMNNYLYNGKELQSELNLDIYDFETRGYDFELAKTWQIDPHLENYTDWSPYSWTGDNPITMVDPSGTDWYRSQENGNLEWIDVTPNEDKSDESYKYQKGYDYVAGADATYEEIRDTYNFLQGDGTFGVSQLALVASKKTGMAMDAAMAAFQSVPDMMAEADTKLLKLHTYVESTEMGAKGDLGVQALSISSELGMFSTSENSAGGLARLSLDYDFNNVSVQEWATPKAEIGMFLRLNLKGNHSLLKGGFSAGPLSLTLKSNSITISIGKVRNSSLKLGISQRFVIGETRSSEINFE